jgi:hypothetical protein
MLCLTSTFVEWDNDCEGLVRTIAREKEWEKCQAFNNTIEWGKNDGSEASLEKGWPSVPADAVWPSYDTGNLTHTHGWPSVKGRVEVVIEIHSSVRDLVERRTTCRCI